ncbi:hypothetical protein B7P43_G04298 [Cryptotermes secundus]|uniref:Uncharacterized protein n=1 Tax=Cryptotermes secundus TaxID=105785 RepID=A0A2J7Q698_9NEOP|nr:hypothetical protein B7P43_G04298 [Cryptotermes secundus]
MKESTGAPGTYWIGGGPQSRSGRRGEEKNLAPTETRTRILEKKVPNKEKECK